MNTADDASARKLREALGENPDAPYEPLDEPADEFESPPVHRVVPAARATRLAVVAKASVFDNGYKPPLPPLDYDSLKSAGPMIPPPMRKGGRYDDLLSLLPIGESKALGVAEGKTLRSAIHELRKKGSRKRFAIRTLSDEQIGIWRLPDATPEGDSNGN